MPCQRVSDASAADLRKPGAGGIQAAVRRQFSDGPDTRRTRITLPPDRASPAKTTTRHEHATRADQLYTPGTCSLFARLGILQMVTRAILHGPRPWGFARPRPSHTGERGDTNVVRSHTKEGLVPRRQL